LYLWLITLLAVRVAKRPDKVAIGAVLQIVAVDVDVVAVLSFIVEGR
jgi:hypothetical protein